MAIYWLNKDRLCLTAMYAYLFYRILIKHLASVAQSTALQTCTFCSLTSSSCHGECLYLQLCWPENGFKIKCCFNRIKVQTLLFLISATTALSTMLVSYCKQNARQHSLRSTMSVPGGGVTSFGIDSYRVWERGGLCEKSPSLSLVTLQHVIAVRLSVASVCPVPAGPKSRTEWHIILEAQDTSDP